MPFYCTHLSWVLVKHDMANQCFMQVKFWYGAGMHSVAKVERYKVLLSSTMSGFGIA